MDRLAVRVVLVLVLVAVVGAGVLLLLTGDDEPSAGPAATAIARDDLRVVDLGAPADGIVEMTVEEGDASVLIVASGRDIDGEVAILAVEGPDGFFVDERDIPQVVNNGENALLLPLRPDEPLAPGAYTVVTDAPDGLREIRAVIKSGDIGGPQVMDVDLDLFTTTGRLADEAAREDLSAGYLDVAEEILGPHELAVGDIGFVDVDPELQDRFAELDLPSSGIDTAQRELCQAIDAEDPDGETEGNASGIPGSVALPDTVTSCVAIQADGTRDLDELAVTTWHEAGHLLGLFHTTELEGEVFDPLADTPECDAGVFDDDGDGEVTEEECGVDGGGDNFMFHDSDATTLTADQAAVLRLSPLFRPVE